MRTTLIPLITTALLGLTLTMGCAPIANPTDQTSTDQSSTDPSIAVSPNTEAVKLVTLAEGLAHPWGMAWLPNGDILITERSGKLRLVRDGVLVPEAIADLATTPEFFASGQGGLLDIALHPRFEENSWIYFTYAKGTGEANRTAVARATFDGENLENWETIFQVSQTKSGGQHFGSRLTWLPDETLLVAIGDGGNPPLRLDGELMREQAQNLQGHLGKVVRIKDDGTIPSDNPFVNDPAIDPAIWSYGHRNIQGMVFDPVTQRIWATEHGARGGDELNWLQAGENYGWPDVSFSADYLTRRPIAKQTTAPDVPNPIQVWTPSMAPSGLAVYHGDRLKGWQGNILAGGLVTQSIHRLELDELGNLVAESQIPVGQRVRDIRQGADGYLYVLTDEDQGQLLRLEPVD